MASVDDIFSVWAPQQVSDVELRVTVHSEIAEKRPEMLPVICDAVVNNLMHESLQRLDEKDRFPLLVSFLARSKAARAGDLGEVMVTEYVIKYSDHPIYIRRLRYKDINNLAMRGDDALAFRLNARGRTEVLKVESKARNRLSKTVLDEAIMGLARNKGRPTPHSIAFVVARLREHGRDAEAEVVQQVLGNTIPLGRVRHLVFTTSGNHPEKLLRNAATAIDKVVTCDFVGLHVPDYPTLIKTVFETLHGAE